MASPFFILLAQVAIASTVQADLHLDTPTQLHRKQVSLDSETGLEAGLHALREGGTNLATYVLWPPRNVDHWAHTQTLLGLIERDVGKLESYEIVRTPAEARSAAAETQVGVLISLEGAHGLGDGPWKERLAELHRRGLRMLGLTWSFSNRFAGSSGDKGGGLTEEGRALVEDLRARGIIVDVSHASRETTLEVCGSSPVPVIASHSNVHAVRSHPRNLTDEELVCIAKTGGVVGVNFHAPFLAAQRDVSAVADMVEAIADRAGFDAVALGSDYDGLIRTPSGLTTSADLPALFVELRRRGWNDYQIDALRGLNFLRAWEGVQAHVASN